MRGLLIAVAAVCLTVASSGCRDGPLYGDDLYEVQIENATATPLMVSEIGAFEGAEPMVSRVVPGKTRLSAWRRPRQNHPEERTTVQARDEAGTVVFCHAYSYADIRAMKQHITITSGRLNC